MTDTATELRRGVGNGDPASVREAEELMDKAADEIERLRAALRTVDFDRPIWEWEEEAAAAIRAVLIDRPPTP